jgi:hypothetical protein
VLVGIDAFTNFAQGAFELMLFRALHGKVGER